MKSNQRSNGANLSSLEMLMTDFFNFWTMVLALAGGNGICLVMVFMYIKAPTWHALLIAFISVSGRLSKLCCIKITSSSKDRGCNNTSGRLRAYSMARVKRKRSMKVFVNAGSRLDDVKIFRKSLFRGTASVEGIIEYIGGCVLLTGGKCGTDPKLTAPSTSAL